MTKIKVLGFGMVRGVTSIQIPLEVGVLEFLKELVVELKGDEGYWDRICGQFGGRIGREYFSTDPHGKFIISFAKSTVMIFVLGQSVDEQFNFVKLFLQSRLDFPANS